MKLNNRVERIFESKPYGTSVWYTYHLSMELIELQTDNNAAGEEQQPLLIRESGDYSVRTTRTTVQQQEPPAASMGVESDNASSGVTTPTTTTVQIDDAVPTSTLFGSCFPWMATQRHDAFSQHTHRQRHRQATARKSGWGEAWWCCFCQPRLLSHYR
ncbi:hypothetical protein BV898_01790 [Hypsibius exemplaris]|uniref:Uncharacterized protein n=1 Tax=Hypsibius exemplaris TaxID=2072580 RepID=A0A1W0X9N5_HYPEX|nr:hypothetical protein BV898_01790 [Hypsibius exemplaris]